MKKNNKGFTLAELLIVVAVIAVLVAVAIPSFTNQLEKSRQAVDVSNLRAAYAAAKVCAIDQMIDSEVMGKSTTYVANNHVITVYYSVKDSKWSATQTDGTESKAKGEKVVADKANLPKVVKYEANDLPNGGTAGKSYIEVKFTGDENDKNFAVTSVKFAKAS